MGEVIPFPKTWDRPLSKRELAVRLGRSVRWVELRVAEGMPSSLVNGRRVFVVGDVEDWLGGTAA